MLSWNGYTSVSSWTVKVWWWNRMELRRCFSTLIHWNKKRSPERSEIFWPGSARKRTVKSVVCVSIRPPLAESRKLQTVRRISDTSCLQPVQQQIPPTDWRLPHESSIVLTTIITLTLQYLLPLTVLPFSPSLCLPYLAFSVSDAQINRWADRCE